MNTLSHNIDLLLQRYAEGTISSTDYKRLLQLLDTPNLPAYYHEERDFHLALSYLHAENLVPTEFETQIDTYIDTLSAQEEVSKHHHRYSWRLPIRYALAASLVLAIGIHYFYVPTFTDTYDDPEKAYATASQAIQLFADNINTACAPLDILDEIDHSDSNNNTHED